MRGAWIEIEFDSKSNLILESRAPCGARGLKYDGVGNEIETIKSRPLRGAWIEIVADALALQDRGNVAPLAGRVD